MSPIFPVGDARVVFISNLQKAQIILMIDNNAQTMRWFTAWKTHFDVRKICCVGVPYYLVRSNILHKIQQQINPI